MLRTLCAAAIAVLTTLSFAVPSSALSYMPPSPESSFARYHAAPELYQVWSGRWIQTQPTPNLGGYVDPLSEAAPIPVLFYFRGRRVGPQGAFGRLRTFPVKVTPQCAGPWCASYPEGGDKAVAFFERPDHGPRRFEEGPCGGASFPRTTGNIQRVAACFTAGMCS